MHVTQHDAKAINKNRNLNQKKCLYPEACIKVRENKSRNNPRETGVLSGAPQVYKLCRAGLRFGWVLHREYRREGPYFVRSFSSSSFFRYCVV